MSDEQRAMEEGGVKDRNVTRDLSNSDLEDHGMISE